MALVEEQGAGAAADDPEALLNEWLGELTVLTARLLELKGMIDAGSREHVWFAAGAAADAGQREWLKDIASRCVGREARGVGACVWRAATASTRLWGSGLESRGLTHTSARASSTHSGIKQRSVAGRAHVRKSQNTVAACLLASPLRCCLPLRAADSASAHASFCNTTHFTVLCTA
ncbi:hypothetical protein SFRURICE_007852 [Spodoptera frugiperda]|nr:hypothetical protein SFRURICE_007852 [Spodoptera frugiperda]